MNVRAGLERKVDRLEESLAAHDAHNDGSLRWVDDRRDLLMALDEAQAELAEYGGYREASER